MNKTINSFSTRLLLTPTALAKAFDDGLFRQEEPWSSADRLNADLEIFRSLGVREDLFSIDKKGVPWLNGKDWAEAFSLSSVVATAKKLERLKGFKKFDTFRTSLSNSDQFSAAAFEGECATCCLNTFKVDDLEFEPVLQIDGGVKKPEFKLALANGKVLAPRATRVPLVFLKVTPFFKTAQRSKSSPNK